MIAPAQGLAASDVADSARIHPRLLQAFAALEESGRSWALLRGADDLASPAGDVDLLVAFVDAPLADLLEGRGFRQVPGAGRGSHQFWFAYNEDDDSWLKLDIVSSLDFGEYQEVRTAMSDGVLRRAQAAGPLRRLDAKDEAWCLLLHLLLDKGDVPAARRAAAVAAARVAAAGDPVLADAPVLGGDKELAAALLAALRDENWAIVSELTRELRGAAGLGRDPRGTARRLAARAARRLSGTSLTGEWGAVIAVLGPDGAGKTTLTRGLLDAFPMPTRYMYMGFWQRRRWDGVVRRVPGARLAVILLRLFWAASRAAYQRHRGRLVLVDRFRHDLAVSADSSFGGRVFARAAVALLPEPDVVVLLDAPAEVMLARKGEHTLEVLEAQRRTYLALVQGQQTAVVVDATLPPELVRRQAVRATWAAHGARRRGGVT